RRRLAWWPAGVVRGPDRDLPAARTVGIRERHVDGAPRLVVDRVLAAQGAVEDLARDGERPGPQLRQHRADGARPEHLPHSERAERPEVGPVVHAMWREPQVGAL